MDLKTERPSADFLKAFGFVVIRQFFNAAPLADEIDRVIRRAFPSQKMTHYGGINFQYVPMMTAETPVSLSLLDRAGALAETLLGAPVLPTRAKGTRYTGDSPWHTDSESPITSLGFLAYCESLNEENGALRVIPGSHQRGSAEQNAPPAHVIDTEPGDLIVIDEHLSHASSGGASRRQWRADFLPVPTDADAEKHTRAYFENIYPADWDGGYDVDQFPSYGPDWRDSGRPWAAQLERLGVYDLAARQEAFARSRSI